MSLCSAAYARTEGKIDVRILDGNQKPVDGVFAQLVNAKDSAMVQYNVSGADGKVEFVNVKQGSYILFISQTGFENYYSPVINVDDAHLQIDLADVTLQSKILKEVTVVGKIPVLQHFADKTVFNVQQSILSSGSNVYDILMRSPGVQIDQNDNVSLQGKSGVTIMIDGKIVPMSSTDLANMLRGMPSDAIDKIEFITNPSAKYDANGSAGIINIILKKDKRLGTNLTVNLGYGQGIYPRTNEGFTFNDRTKKLNLFANYNYSYRGFSNAIDFKTDFYNGSNYQGGTIQHENLLSPNMSNTARIGADFFASDKTTIGFIADGSISKSPVSEGATTYVYDSLSREQSYNITNSSSPNTSYNYAGNFNLKHKFDSIGRELLINVDYACYQNQGYENIVTNYYNLDNTEASSSSIYGSLPGQLNIYSFKADYDGQLGKKGSLEAGLKTSYVKTDNSVNIYDGANSSAPVDTIQTNHFIYSENINAGYVSYNRNIHKASLQLGIRAEQTIADGNQVATGDQFSRNFFQLFPNVSINDSIAKDHQLGFSVTRRIDRPTYEQLNPFSLYINPTFYLLGNPYLLPQNSYTYQLSDSYKEKYFLTLTYTHTINPITVAILPFPGRPDVVEQTNVNLSSLDYYGGNFTAVTQITSWWSTTTSADAFVNHYNATLSGTALNSYRFLWDANTDNNFTITKKFTGDINAYYFSGFDLGYLTLKPQWSLSAGVQAKIMDNRGTIRLNVSDIFWTQLTDGVTTFNGFNESVFVRRDTRMVNLSFSYHFGGTSTSQSLHSKGGAEDEKNRVKSN